MSSAEALAFESSYLILYNKRAMIQEDFVTQYKILFTNPYPSLQKMNRQEELTFQNIYSDWSVPTKGSNESVLNICRHEHCAPELIRGTLQDAYQIHDAPETAPQNRCALPGCHGQQLPVRCPGTVICRQEGGRHADSQRRFLFLLVCKRHNLAGTYDINESQVPAYSVFNPYCSDTSAQSWTNGSARMPILV